MGDRIRLYAFADEAASSVDGQIQALRENGMDGLEIRKTEYGSAAKLTPENAAEIRRKLDDAGLCLWSIGSAVGKKDIREPFEPQLDTFKRLLEVAHVFGAKRFRLFSFYMPEGEDPAVYEGAVLDRMGALVEQAKGSGVTLCHENEKRIFGDVTERELKLLETFPSLRAVFDPANFIQCGVDPWAAWQKLKPYVDYLHVKDATPDGLVVPAGQGVGRVKEIIADYFKSGGRDFTLEPHLWLFDGLAKLETLDARTIDHSKQFGSAEAAFRTAAEAFRGIVDELA